MIDTSALFAILNAEPDADRIARRILDEDVRSRVLSAASFLELGTLGVRRLPDAAQPVEALVEELSIRVEPFTHEHARIAVAAYARFGKGGGSRARLNLGDCFAYALAKALDAPLLYKGDDFPHTDIRSALGAAA